MSLAFLLLAVAALAIYISCEAFTNAIEWLGQRLKLSETATGAILAAIGTALPESAVTLIAVAFGATPSQKDIGIGAALGGPLVLSTVGYGLIGLMVFGLSDSVKTVKIPKNQSTGRLVHDQVWFLCIFSAGFILGLVKIPDKYLFGIIFIMAYMIYIWRELSSDEETGEYEQLERLLIRPNAENPETLWIVIQTLLAVGLIFAASKLFVEQVSLIATQFGLPPQLCALLLSPIATEMPEIVNAVIWIRQGKTRMALANISGAMMIQATIPAAFGILFTSWQFERSAVIAAATTIFATLTIASFAHESA